MGLRGGHLVARFVFGCWAQGSPLAPTFFSVLFLCLVVFGELSGGDALSSLALLDFPNFCVLSALAGAFRYVGDWAEPYHDTFSLIKKRKVQGCRSRHGDHFEYRV